MGRWSFAPMGSDDALDARGVFLDYVGELKGVHFQFPFQKSPRQLFQILYVQVRDKARLF